MHQDFYAVLGLPTTANESEIRERFRRMTKEHHPDRVPVAERSGALERFQKITQAANTLLDAERRLAYDRQRMIGEGASGGGDEAVRVLIQRGVAAFREGDLRTALDSLERATQSTPQDARAWHLLAQVAGKIPPKRTVGLRAAQKSVELEPHNPKYLLTSARLHLAAERHAAAQNLLKQAEQWGADAAQVAQLQGELKGRR